MSLTIRPATKDDAKRVFDLANEAGVRANSFHTAEIKWGDHQDWFQRKLQDPQSMLLLLWDDQVFVGQVRFDIDHDSAVVGVSIVPEKRGQGLGTTALDLGIQYLHLHRPEAKRLIALIKPDNRGSIRAFEKAGFKFSRSTEENGTPALEYRREV